MNLFELIYSALLSLRAHKFRVFLTMIGIIIGISSVVTILSIGAGLKSQVNQSTKNVSVNTITINFEAEDFNSMEMVTAFQYSDFKNLQNVDGVEKVNESGGGLGINLGINENAEFFDRQTSLMMSTYNKENLNLIYGRRITSEDDKFKNYVIILTEDHAKSLFGTDLKQAIGKGINIKGEFFEVVGIQKKDSTGLDMSYDYIPTFTKTFFQNDTQISSIDVKIKQGYAASDVFKSVQKELKILHPDLKGKYVQADPQAITKSIEKIIGGLTLFIAIVSGISLFVGGIGVMNIMYVSVTERRREIGIRRAIGAKPNTIVLQFLIESIFITGIGGILGISIGYGISAIIGLFLPFKPVLTIGTLIGSSITSISVGIIFGIIPAYKAGNLNPIKAIYK
ncbi:ABC transporter permease [Clostridium pasteurianum]|uniref:ABC transporter permease n=1 Tax=Clostridium pasteurianum TaxID=1501 RepID=UPI002260F7B1|nr:ABC transporter permease [Clostridium pasteurianum]UZW14758.1 ABC transporter permease [Clostridium pasteurianum]